MIEEICNLRPLALSGGKWDMWISTKSTCRIQCTSYQLRCIVYHIANPNPTTLVQLVDAIRDAGRELECVDAAAFRKRMRSLQDEQHPLYAFASVLRGVGYASAKGPAERVTMPDDKRTRAVAGPDWCPQPGPQDVAALLEWCDAAGMLG